MSFDPAKRDWTLKHRRIDFATDADVVFAGRIVTVMDDRHDYGEIRQISAGHLRGRMVVIVWTWRGAQRHIISMRYCHAKEEKYWTTLLREATDR